MGASRNRSNRTKAGCITLEPGGEVVKPLSGFKQIYKRR